MLKAKALFYAIFVSLLLVLISGVFIQFAHDSYLVFDYDAQRMRLVDNMQAAELILCNENSLAHQQPMLIDLYQNGQDSAELNTIDWGLWRIGTAKVWQHTFKGKDELKKSLLLGISDQSNAYSYSLTMPNKNKPLVVSGKTHITGRLLLGSQGIKQSTVEGKYAEFPVNSEISTNIQRFLPILDTMAIVKAFSHRAIPPTAPKAPLDQMVSFFEPTHTIKGGVVNLAGCRLKGNIIVVADSLVIIDASSMISDIMVVSKYISVSSGFKGNAQLFAEVQIKVEENVELLYPSALVVALRHSPLPSMPNIQVMSNSKITGLVVAWDRQKRKSILTEIQPEATLQGHLFCEGYLDLKGKIEGCAFVEGFIYKSASGVYDNYLVDGKIDYLGLPLYFGGAFLLGADAGKERVVCKQLE